MIVREASTLATETRSARGLPPLPRTTPHSLRRTYISIALLANRFDAVVRDARVQLHGAEMRPEKATKRRREPERPGLTALDE